MELAYALGNDLGKRYDVWLKEPARFMLMESPEAKVTTAFLLHPRVLIENASQAKQLLKMWLAARGEDQATPSSMVATLRTMTMATKIRQKIEQKFDI